MGAEKREKGVCFIFLPPSFSQALFRKQPIRLKPGIAAIHAANRPGLSPLCSFYKILQPT
jgi:hypothetical protein